MAPNKSAAAKATRRAPEAPSSRPRRKRKRRETLPQALKRIMAEKGWKARRRLAEAVGVSPSTVTRWFKGERVPDGPHLRALFALGVKADTLLRS